MIAAELFIKWFIDAMHFGPYANIGIPLARLSAILVDTEYLTLAIESFAKSSTKNNSLVSFIISYI